MNEPASIPVIDAVAPRNLEANKSAAGMVTTRDPGGLKIAAAPTTTPVPINSPSRDITKMGTFWPTIVAHLTMALLISEASRSNQPPSGFSIQSDPAPDAATLALSLSSGISIIISPNPSIRVGSSERNKPKPFACRPIVSGLPAITAFTKALIGFLERSTASGSS